MPVILRVQNADNEGMYHSGLWERCVHAYECKHHPSPLENAVLANALCALGGAALFGFKDERQLLRWIYRKDWRESLSNAGAYIGVYRVPTYAASDAQVIFNGGEAVLIRTLSITVFDSDQAQDTRAWLAAQEQR